MSAFPSRGHGTSLGQVNVELQIISEEAQGGCRGMRISVQNILQTVGLAAVAKYRNKKW